MSTARLEARLRLIQTAIEGLNRDAQSIEPVMTIKVFAVGNGQEVSPPQGRMWKILSLWCTHETGTDSSIQVYDSKSQIFTYYNLILAAAATEQKPLPYLGELWLNHNCKVMFQGAAAAYIQGSALELPEKINIVQQRAT